MALIPDFGVFMASVVLISMSGVLLPGPLFAVTIEKATKWKTAGALIALGHGVVEFPLMFLIYFVLSQFAVPDYVQTGIGFVGGSFMIYMGADAFMKRNKEKIIQKGSSRESFLAGIWTSAANVGFILWWLTVLNRSDTVPFEPDEYSFAKEPSQGETIVKDMANYSIVEENPSCILEGYPTQSESRGADKVPPSKQAFLI